MITLLVSPEQLDLATTEVQGDTFRHLFKARRLAVDAEIRLVDGHGRAHWSKVLEVGPTSARLQIGNEAPAHEPCVRLELLTPVLRPQRLTWLVEKATEVGVAAIRLIHSERAPRRCGAQTLQRLSRVAAAAVEQCHRAVVPEITGAHGWSEIPAVLETSEERWLLEPGETERSGVEPGTSVAVIVGPEGGWTESETEFLLSLGCRRIGLGPTVLRTETAAIVGSALLLDRARNR